MKRITIVIMLFIGVMNVSAKNFRVMYESGYGIYSLEALKKIQTDMLQNISGIPAQSVEQFPNYLNHSVSLAYYMDQNNLFGINASYLTTGGRNHVRDYSGEYNFDMIINGYQFGVESEHIINLQPKLDLHANFKTGVIQSRLSISEVLYLQQELLHSYTENESQFDFFLEPNLGISYKILPRASVRTSVGYSLNTLAFESGSIHWSGLRFRLGLAVKL
jgi:hypothetical protein